MTGVLTDAGEEIALSGGDLELPTPYARIANCINGSVGAAFERRRKYEPACSGVVLYLGLNRRYEHCCTTTSSSAAIRTRSSIGFTEKANPPPTRPVISPRRLAPNRVPRRPAAKRSTCWSTRPICARITIGKRCCPSIGE